MQIGFFYPIKVPSPWDARTAYDRYWEMMDQVVLAEEVRFTAPPPGNYQFVCTFPGHNFTMFGVFEVTR